MYPFFKDLHDQTDVFDGVFGRAPTTVNLFFENSLSQSAPRSSPAPTSRFSACVLALGRLLNESMIASQTPVRS